MTTLSVDRWAVPAALVWTVLFAAGHVWAVFDDGRHPVGTDPGTGATGWGNVLPNAVVVVLCTAAVLLLVRSPRLPAPLAACGLWVGVPLLVVRGVAGAVDQVLIHTGVMPYGMFDGDRGEVTTGWATWSGTVVDSWFLLGAAVFAAALGPRMLRRDRRGEAIPGPRPSLPDQAAGTGAGRGGPA
ncbi:hypothetical protein [Streptomyces sp. NPDC049879]|uniref:hypothetical protein n=1 Tax=Streptomyces sp. NPDC049879 TaxID=3365598 RepID=UPI0037B7CE3B